MSDVSPKKLAQVNTVQCDKKSSNLNNGESNSPKDIKNWIIVSNVDLLPVMESFSPPKRRVWIRLSISLILLIRVNLWLEKWVQRRKKCIVDSIKFPLLHKGFIASSKLCRNLCSLRWLRPTRNLVKVLLPLHHVHWICYLL